MGYISHVCVRLFRMCHCSMFSRDPLSLLQAHGVRDVPRLFCRLPRPRCEYVPSAPPSHVVHDASAAVRPSFQEQQKVLDPHPRVLLATNRCPGTSPSGQRERSTAPDRTIVGPPALVTHGGITWEGVASVLQRTQAAVDPCAKGASARLTHRIHGYCSPMGQEEC